MAGALTRMLGRPPAAATGHRYYKLVMTSTLGGANQALCHLRMYATVGGSDFLAAAVSGATATVTASSTSGGNTVANLTDVDDGLTAWVGNSTSETIFVDLGATAANWKDVNEIGIAPLFADMTKGPKDLSWHYSDDGSSYTQRFALTDLSHRGTSNPDNANFGVRLRTPASYPTPAAGSHRIWGLDFKTSDATLIDITGAELRNSLGGANRCTGGQPSSRLQFSSSFDPSNGWDGTRWASSTVLPAWLFYEHFDGAEQPKPAQIMIKADASNPARAPRTFDLVYRDYNGGTVTVQQSFSTGAWSTPSEVRTFTVT